MIYDYIFVLVNTQLIKSITNMANVNLNNFINETQHQFLNLLNQELKFG